MVMKKTSIADIFELSVAARVLLVEDIWDSIAEAPEALPLTAAQKEEQKEEMDRRLAAFHQDPGAGSPWHEVVARIKSRPFEEVRSL